MKYFKLTINKRPMARDLDFQFCCAVYLKDEYLKHGGKGVSNLYSDWGGVEFGNSWKDGIKHAQNIVAKNPEFLCVLIDMMNRKKPLEIQTTNTNDHEKN